MAVRGEECKLRAGNRLHPADNELHWHGVGLPLKSRIVQVGEFVTKSAITHLLFSMIAVGLIALTGAALACASAAPMPPDARETATNAASSDQPLSNGTESIPVEQQFGDSESTPLPTICADTVDAEGRPIKDCGPPPPMEGDDEDSKISGELQSLVEDAQKTQEDRHGGVTGAVGHEELLRPQRHRVWIRLTADTDGHAIIAWLEEREFQYEDHRDTGTIYAGVDITAIPDLIEVEGVLRLREPIKFDPS